MQIDLHHLGDEEAEAQDRTHRAFDIVERGADPGARQPRQIGHRARRLQRAQYIGRGIRVERVGVEEVRPREHVEHRRPGRGQIGGRPGADLRQLMLLELAERGVEEFGVALPRGIPGQRRQRGIGRRRHARQEQRGIVDGDVGGARRQGNRQKKQGCSDSCHFSELKHLHSRPGDAVAWTGSARPRKTA